ncbi:hypothetical protein M514_08591 [Trichuris suis]|uniref:Retrotransposon gag domain-containing protein n=1 Tax=Trichuris suis TaxID=68888 RepID=A0A085N1V7_9BILA|nr:hypothetical protein M513_08591 [Trichuris suis]KFD63453.1 hypothetical protein M514_08591 [Trichuris suis]
MPGGHEIGKIPKRTTHKMGQSREMKINYENTEARCKTPRLLKQKDRSVRNSQNGEGVFFEMFHEGLKSLDITLFTLEITGLKGTPGQFFLYLVPCESFRSCPCSVLNDDKYRTCTGPLSVGSSESSEGIRAIARECDIPLTAKRADAHSGSLSVPAALNVSLPRQFDNGDFIEWASRCELCSRSDGWNDTVMAMKLPTLLEGDAYTIYQSLPQDVLSSYHALKQVMVARLHPGDLVHSALQRFEEKNLTDGETVESFAYHLRRLLSLAMPRLDASSAEKLLLHHLIRGLPIRTAENFDCATILQHWMTLFAKRV